MTTENEGLEQKVEEIQADKAETSTEETKAPPKTYTQEELDKAKEEATKEVQRRLTFANAALRNREEKDTTIADLKRAVARLTLYHEASMKAQEVSDELGERPKIDKEAIDKQWEQMNQQDIQVQTRKAAIGRRIEDTVADAGLDPFDEKLGKVGQLWTEGKYEEAEAEANRVARQVLKEAASAQKVEQSKAEKEVVKKLAKADVAAPSVGGLDSWSKIQDAYIRGDMSLEEYTRRKQEQNK